MLTDSLPPGSSMASLPLAMEDTPFLRLWHGFLTGRVMVALALLLLQALGQLINQNGQPVVLAVCLAYFMAAVVVRVAARHAPPAPHAGVQWLPSIGVDLAAMATLQLLHTGSLNFTPLFGLPILMASVLGTLTLALGTTAAVTLLLLSWAWWLGPLGVEGVAARHSLGAARPRPVSFLVASRLPRLPWRVGREQQVAQRSKVAALV